MSRTEIFHLAAVRSPSNFQKKLWCDNRLSATRKLILAYLAYRFVWDRKDEYGYLTVTHKEIGACTGLARETVTRQLSWLIEHGYLDHQQPVSANQYQTGRFRLCARGFDHSERVTQDHQQTAAAANPLVIEDHQIGDAGSQRRSPSIGVVADAKPGGLASAASATHMGRVRSAAVDNSPHGERDPIAVGDVWGELLQDHIVDESA